jgi:outer membrane lipoprotein-sorting protein
MITRILTILAVAAFAMGCVSRAGAATLTQQSSVDEILDALDARGKDLQSFSSDLKLGESDAATGDESAHTGKFSYQTGDSPRIHVVFDKKIAAGKIIEDKIEYLLKDRTLIDRTYRTKTQITREVLKPGEKMNLFKLGEGPFPLPLGQKKEDVHSQFDVAKVDAKKDDPAQTVHIQLTVKPGTKLEKKFKTIDVWVELTDNMPRKIETLDYNQTTIRTTELSNVRVNPVLIESDFALPEIKKEEWQLREEAFSD